MAFTTIDKSSDYFNTKLYTGTGSSQVITGVGFQPDFIWTKTRNEVEIHCLNTTIQGINNYLRSNDIDQLETSGSNITAQSSDGYTVGTTDRFNQSSNTFVSWNWKANGQGSANTDGTINTTYTSASATSGFSISTYTGTGSAGTIGHGLGVAPTAIWTKRTSATENWFCWNKGLPSAGGYLKLDMTQVTGTSNTVFPWNPQANTFGVSADAATNASGVTYIAYCFAEKQGYSKFGSYIGNGNADGTFVYTGFKPAFVLIKNTAATEAWFLFDNKRGYNGSMAALYPNEAAAEGFANNIDLLSNGFKLRTAGAHLNSSATFIYMAFAEAPLVGTNNVPATAR
jgi:hypothetical protein